MAKEIVVRYHLEETVVALWEDGILRELYLERASGEQLCGSIFKGIVENVLPGMQAAFINIGSERNAFLYIDDAMPDDMDRDIVPNISHLLKSGQEVLVQVIKEASGQKGARVSRKISLAGRYSVLMPGDQHIGISRKITNEKTREQISQMARTIRGDRKCGLIVRTAAEKVQPEQLQADFEELLSRWEQISRKAKEAPPQTLIYQDYTLITRTLRDLLDSDTKVVVNDENLYNELRQLLKESPFRHSLRLVDDEGIEAAYNLSVEIEKANKRRIWLKNGGYLVIDQTEAMTVIDVNTGKFIGKNDLQQTIFAMNLEAAEEIARQICLRNLSGIIIVDFIDMLSQEHQETVLAALNDALAKDKINTTVQGLSHLGLVEITRKKMRQPLWAVYEKECPYCAGKGRVVSEDTTAIKIEANLREIAWRSDCQSLAVLCHPVVAARLIGENGQKLQAMEREFGKTISICAKGELLEYDYKVQALHKIVDDGQNPVVERGEILSLTITDVHIERKSDGLGRIDGFVINVIDGAKYLNQTIMVEIEKVFWHNAVAKVLKA